MNDSKVILDFDPTKEKIERRASFSFPMNFTGKLLDARETQSGLYIIAEFEGEQVDVKTKAKITGIVPVIQPRGVWAGLFTDNNVPAPCFIAGLQILTDKTKVKFVPAS